MQLAGAVLYDAAVARAAAVCTGAAAGGACCGWRALVVVV